MSREDVVTRRVVLGGWNLVPRRDRVVITPNENAADDGGGGDREPGLVVYGPGGQSAVAIIVRREPPCRPPSTRTGRPSLTSGTRTVATAGSFRRPGGEFT